MSKKAAILIGVNYLKSNKYRLSSPINDIGIVNDFLVNYCNFNYDDITMLSDSPKVKGSASFFNIVKCLKYGQQLSEKDYFFIYFSGHSCRDIKDKITNIDTVDTADNDQELFLPQDWEVNKITEKLLESIIKNYKCRCFIMFDCCNSGKNYKYRYNYDVKHLQEKIEMQKKDQDNNIFFLSSSGINKNTFEKFLEKNLINSDKNKFYGELTIFFLQVLKNYLEKNLSFKELTYEKLIFELSEYLKDIENVDLKTVDYRLTHNFILNKNLLPLASISNNNFKNSKLFYSLEEDQDENQKEANNLNILKRKTVSTLSYKYLKLKRKTDYLEKINDDLQKRNDKLLSVISGNIRYNFGVIK